MSRTTPELGRLGRDSGFTRAWAYFDVRRGDPRPRAEARLHRARWTATPGWRQVHGYDLMHIGRIHTVQLWAARAGGRRGAGGGALDGANAILAYVNGFGSDLPLGRRLVEGSGVANSGGPAAAMTYRVADEVGDHSGRAGSGTQRQGAGPPDCAGPPRSRPPRRDRRLGADQACLVPKGCRTSSWSASSPTWPPVGARPACGMRRFWILCRAARALQPGPRGRRFCADVAESAREESRGATRAA